MNIKFNKKEKEIKKCITYSSSEEKWIPNLINLVI